jgi:geranylgeranyl pyrophosphate synthase
MESFDTLGSHDEEMLLRIQEKKATAHDIHHAKKLFTELGVIRKAHEAIEEETMTARRSLEQIRSREVREGLMQFGEYLLGRAY